MAEITEKSTLKRGGLEHLIHRFALIFLICWIVISFLPIFTIDKNDEQRNYLFLVFSKQVLIAFCGYFLLRFTAEWLHLKKTSLGAESHMPMSKLVYIRENHCSNCKNTLNEWDINKKKCHECDQELTNPNPT